jgi:hypothetical protein
MVRLGRGGRYRIAQFERRLNEAARRHANLPAGDAFRTEPNALRESRCHRAPTVSAFIRRRTEAL